jgi:hypothetical protein
MLNKASRKDALNNPISYATRLSVNAVAIVVGYRLWTNKPLTTFDKITFTIGLFGISFVAFLMFDTQYRRMIIEGDY